MEEEGWGDDRGWKFGLSSEGERQHSGLDDIIIKFKEKLCVQGTLLEIIY